MTVLATVLYRLAVCHFGCRCEVAQKPQTVLKSALLMRHMTGRRAAGANRSPAKCNSSNHGCWKSRQPDVGC